MDIQPSTVPFMKKTESSANSSEDRGVQPSKANNSKATWLSIFMSNQSMRFSGGYVFLGMLFPSEVDGRGRVSDANSLGNQETIAMDFVSKITIDWDVWELFETLKLVRKNDMGSWQRFVSNIVNIKAQVDKLLDLMTTVTAVVPDNETLTDDYDRMLSESESMLLELRLLSAILASSEQQLEDSMLLIRDSVEKLLSGKQSFEYFLSPLIPQMEYHADSVDEGGIECEADQVGFRNKPKDNKRKKKGSKRRNH